MTPPLDPRRRALARAIGLALADQVWAEITSGNPAAQNGTAPHAVAGEAETVPETNDDDRT